MSANAKLSMPKAFAGPAGASRRSISGHLLLTLPLVSLLAALYAWPMLRVLLLSLNWPELSLESYLRIATVPAYSLVMLNTLWISFAVTSLCLLLGYPVAFLLVGLPRRRARLLLLLVVIPFGTSLLVRNYSWMVLLGNNGLVNNLLLWLGLVEQPLPLLYNSFGAILGMTHILLPYMVLVLASAMRNIDPSLGCAAQSLGAAPLRAFLTVFLPLSLPGITAGCTLVFIMSLGFFVTPALLGGRGGTMISMVIEVQINRLVNWPMGAALSVVLLVVTFALIALYNRLLGLRRITRDLL